MLRFILKNTQSDSHTGMFKETHHTIDVNCPELESLLLVGGHGQDGFDTNELVGVEVRVVE